MSQMTKKPRDWMVLARDYDSEEDFRQALTQELAGLENIGHRTGGAFVATPLRQAQPVDAGDLVGLPETEHVVIGWHFRQVFMPAAQATEPEPDDTPADEEPTAEPAAV